MYCNRENISESVLPTLPFDHRSSFIILCNCSSQPGSLTCLEDDLRNRLCILYSVYCMSYSVYTPAGKPQVWQSRTSNGNLTQRNTIAKWRRDILTYYRENSIPFLVIILHLFATQGRHPCWRVKIWDFVQSSLISWAIEQDTNCCDCTKGASGNWVTSKLCSANSCHHYDMLPIKSCP